MCALIGEVLQEGMEYYFCSLFFLFSVSLLGLQLNLDWYVVATLLDCALSLSLARFADVPLWRSICSAAGVYMYVWISKVCSVIVWVDIMFLKNVSSSFFPGTCCNVSMAFKCLTTSCTKLQVYFLWIKWLWRRLFSLLMNTLACFKWRCTLVKVYSCTLLYFLMLHGYSEYIAFFTFFFYVHIVQLFFV